MASKVFRIALVLTSRFPSEKAYAVTTSETAKAALSLGIPTRIYAPSNSAHELTTCIENLLIRKLSFLLGRTPGKFDASIFMLRRIAVAFKFKKILRNINSPDLIVWTRDPLIALLTRTDVSVFLEIHSRPSRFDGVVFKVLNNRRRFAVGTLTKDHKDQLQKFFLKCDITILPMGVSGAFFNSKRQQVIDEKIGYIGKGWSSGQDNKLTDLIEAAKLVDVAVEKRKQWEFLGLEPNYRTTMEKLVSSIQWRNSEFGFVDHVSHKDVPNFLRLMTIGLVPYHDSEYNRQRFPIKALEYAAAGVSILATDTPGNRRILNSDICYFYTPDDTSSLTSVLTLILNDYEGRRQKIENARDWAKTHSYEARVEIVLNSIAISNARSPIK